MEEWKDVVIDDVIPIGLYQVSNKGRVKKLYKYCGSKIKHIYSPHLLNECHNRYTVHTLRNHFEHSKISISTHRLVAIMFLDNKENYPCVNHIDRDINNNYVENLEWCTYQYNCIHGMLPFNNRKYNIEKLHNDNIVDDYVNNSFSIYRLKVKYNLSQPRIRRLLMENNVPIRSFIYRKNGEIK